jgi:hypothetical protein
LAERVTELFAREDVHTWEGSFIVATDRKVRILKPRNK